MSKTQKTLQVLSILLFSIGLLFGLILWGGSAWADLEGYLFDPGLPAEQRLSNIRCPLVITSDEIGLVSMVFNNPVDRPLKQSVRARVSYGFVTQMKEINTTLEMEPFETRELAWEVSPTEAAWNRLVLVRLYMFRSAPLPSRTATCGILVLDLPGMTGSQVVTLVSLIGLLGMAGGIGLWYRANRPLTPKPRYALNIMIGLVLMVAAGLALTLAGYWAFAGLLFLLGLVAIAVVLAYFFQSSR